MKKFILLAMLGAALTAQAQYQLPNGDFEGSYSTSGNNQIPEGWNWFNTSEGSLGSTAQNNSYVYVKEDGDNHYVHVEAGYYSFLFVKTVVNGNLTTGIINAGSMTATDATGNYNFIDPSSNKGQTFTGKPDAMSFKIATYLQNSSHKAQINTVIVGNGRYQDPEASGSDYSSVKWGTATFQQGNNTTFTTQTVEFTAGTKQSEITPAGVIISLSTNTTGGSGTKGDYIAVDDIKFIYYHALSDLKYNNTTVANFDEATLSYDLSDTEYDESLLSYTVKGVGATAEKSYDSETAVLTITVKGNDYESDNTSITTYTVKFKKPAMVVSSETYNEYLVVKVDGNATEPQAAAPVLTTYSDGSCTFQLKNFMLTDSGQTMPIGNITLKNVTMTEKDGYTEIATTQTITIEDGDDESVSFWYGPELQQVPIVLTGKIVDGEILANIDIDMSATLQQVINVVLSNIHEATIDGTATVEQTEQPCIYEVKVTRTFKEGWNTWCMPVSISLPDLGSEVKAQQFASADDSGLNFEKVSGTLAAGTPYLVWFPAQTTANAAGGYVTTYNLTLTEVTDNGFTFQGNYVSGLSMSGKYGVADIDGVQKIMLGGASSTLPATCAYFNTTNANAEGMQLNLEGEATGINALTLTPASEGAVFNLQGVKVSNGSTQGLPAGIYVKAGKKIIIK